MGSKEFRKEMEKRTKEFALSIIKLSSRLPKTLESNVLRYQLTKSGTSIGANYREANRARSRAEFKSKMKICESEASETSYWLELLSDLDQSNYEDLRSNLPESNEILAIFSSVGKKLNSSQSKL
ncbi:MAG: four helix bundle protein [Bacteroidales bacterium]|nr:four helix bundle protein [Bacteroidales bacterium]